jgi:hypothetical protein
MAERGKLSDKHVFRFAIQREVLEGNKYRQVRGVY